MIGEGDCGHRFHDRHRPWKNAWVVPTAASERCIFVVGPAGGDTTCTATQSTSNASDGTPGTSDGKSAPASGTSKGGTGTGNDPSDLCALHPNLNVCQNSQVVGNGCSGGLSTIAYSGDAIDGAILKKVADDMCAKATASDGSKLYDQMNSGNDPLSGQIPTKSNGKSIDISNGHGLDQSTFLGSSCFADKSYSYGGRQLTIPFSNVCPYLLPLRAVVMFAALMGAYFMLSGAILRS